MTVLKLLDLTTTVVFWQVAFKFVPTREVFLQHVAGTTEATDDMAAFIDAFAPVLEEVLKWLVCTHAAMQLVLSRFHS